MKIFGWDETETPRQALEAIQDQAFEAGFNKALREVSGDIETALYELELENEGFHYPEWVKNDLAMRYAGLMAAFKILQQIAKRPARKFGDQS